MIRDDIHTPDNLRWHKHGTDELKRMYFWELMNMWYGASREYYTTLLGCIEPKQWQL